MALVLAAQQRTGAGVDVNHLTVSPDAGVLLIGLVDAADRVSAGFERIEHIQREGLLHLEDVGQVLVVKAGRINGLLDVEAASEDGEKDIGHGGDDACASR